MQAYFGGEEVVKDVGLVFFLLACVLVAGCSSEPVPEARSFRLDDCLLNCLKFGDSYSCDFAGKVCPTTTFAGMYDGCDAVGCFLYDGDGNKVYVSLFDEPSSSVRSTTTSLPPEGLLDMKRRLKRWFG